MLKPALAGRRRARPASSLPRDTSDGGPAVLVGLPWARRTVRLQRAWPPRSAAASTPLRFKIQSAQLRRVRREAGVRAGPVAAADRVPRRKPRRSGLRGHLERGRLRGAWRRGRRSADRAERLALLDGQAAPALRGRATRASRRRACRSLTSIRSAARTSSSSTAPPSCSMPTASLAVQMPAWEEALGVTEWQPRRWSVALPARGASAEIEAGRCRRTISPASRAYATMSRRTASPAWCSGFRAASIPRFAPPWRSMR